MYISLINYYACVHVLYIQIITTRTHLLFKLVVKLLPVLKLLLLFSFHSLLLFCHCLLIVLLHHIIKNCFIKLRERERERETERQREFSSTTLCITLHHIYSNYYTLYYMCVQHRRVQLLHVYGRDHHYTNRIYSATEGHPLCA